MSAVRWSTAQNGNWGVAANWSPMTVPGISDDVTIDAAGTYTITIAPYAFVHTLNLNDTGATLALGGGADLIVAGDANFSGGQITGNQGTLALEGNTTVNGPTVIQGLLIHNDGNLNISSYFRSDFGVTGTRIILNPGAVAEFSGVIAGFPGVDEPIVFTAAGELAKFDGPIVEGPTFPISGFQRGDQIDLTGITATSLTYSNGNLALFNGSIFAVLTLQITTPYISNFFHISPDGSGGTILTVASGSPPVAPARYDFNGDKISDILWQNTNGQVATWLSTAPFIESVVGSNPGPSWQVIGAGDFNGDGDADILWQNTNGQPAIWLMNGTTPFSEPVVGSNPGPSWEVIGTGDFNGDGDADILWQNTNGQAAIWLMNGTTPFSEATVGANPGLSWHVVGAGDFNGDGKSDILWQNTNGQAAIWLMNGTTPISEPLVGTNPGSSWHIVGTGDFNGDGDSDILWQNTSGQAAIWLMNGATPFDDSVVGANPGPSWHIFGTGDYNGDGKSDILWQNANGQASTWLMSGTTPTAELLVGSNPGATWHIHAAS